MAKARTLIVDHGRDRARWRPPSALRGGRQRSGSASDGSLLKEVATFGPNPGALKMLAYAPETPAGAMPLVVVLHGCTQDARGYDTAAGWSRLADALGFAVLFPEQARSNNPAGCFNWFLPADAARGLGEARSIREMVERLCELHDIDRGRIFVTGLSAGGAMTAALLADYPDLFSAGAVIAGLPCGSATSMQEAFRAMSQPEDKSSETLGDMVRTASPHLGPWPRMLVIHGDKDRTVAPGNASALVKQWLDVHGAGLGDFEDGLVDGHRRRVWRKDGRAVVESIMVAGMGHGAPLDTASGERKAPYMLDVGLSSTRRIADFFGIAGAMAAKPSGARPAGADRTARASQEAPRRAGREEPAPGGWRLGQIDVSATINKALKAAGLIK